jgi:hypothetical protein
MKIHTTGGRIPIGGTTGIMTGGIGGGILHTSIGIVPILITGDIDGEYSDSRQTPQSSESALAS